MDERQDRAFKEALERKKADAKRRGELPHEDTPAPEDSHPREPADSERAKSSRHGGITADKWNQ